MVENRHTLDYAAAAQLLGVHPDTIRNWKRRKGLPFVKPGRAVKFAAEELLAWQDKQRPTTSPAGETPAPAHDSPSGKSDAVGG